MWKPVINKRTGIAILSVFVAALIISGCATTGSFKRHRSGIEGVVVVAAGEVPIDPEDLIGTKKQALIEAQKNAVEMAAGVHVSATTVVEKSVAVSSTVVSAAEGYIDSFKILSEKRDSELYTVRIKALVRVGE